jgi:hypothetical protein
VEWELNPVKITKKEQGQIEESIKKFGLALHGVKNIRVRSHQRKHYVFFKLG